MAKKRKPPSIAKLVEKAAERLQLYIRLKGCDDNGYCKCATCGVVRHYKDGMQGGHFISRKYLATKLMEDNLAIQCQRCNGPLGGNMAQFTIYMIDHYGREHVDYLLKKKHEIKKYTKQEIKEFTDDINRKIKDLESKIIG